ncbi:efflux RND transporter permease subunit [Candidatus Thiothrix anitrata]|uniref:Efflux RND transporter permease subunit n=1 Tax=Candidatus Thiothrix anitrata TaxID=2823902 RepID=A0ABX7X216_9GAMM|nr:efflux RND transporter permease subunit [Candidatus Thiothrix anitrata]QTR48823.1 efflux RND transporter permease subunit [Candidatus Thiothrix anitrata]
MYKRLLQNYVLANLTFGLVLVIGLIAYNTMPRQQDPTINFNWISIITALPGGECGRRGKARHRSAGRGDSWRAGYEIRFQQ